MGGMSAEEIYSNFHDKATGTGSLEDASDAAKRLAAQLPDRAAQIQRAAGKMRSFWQGDAEGAAASGATPLSAMQISTGEDNGQANNLSQSQALAFHATKNAVTRVPPKPDIGDYMLAAAEDPMGLNPDAMTSVQDKAAQHTAVSHANVAAYDQYHSVSTENGRLPTDSATLPTSVPNMQITRKDSPGPGSVTQPPDVRAGGNDGVNYPSRDQIGGSVSRGPTIHGSSGDTTTSPGSVPGGGGTMPAGSVPAGTGGSGTSLPSGQTSPSGAGGGGASGGVGGTGGAFGGDLGGGDPRSRGGRNARGGGGDPIGGMPIAGGAAGVGAGGGDIPRGGRAIRSGGSTGAGGEIGGRAAAGGGSGSAGRTVSGIGQEPGAGGRSGVGPGAAAAEQQAMRTGAAGEGGRGAMGGPMGGGRGSKGGEDSEHKSPHYLQENDPDSVFGTDEKTAPPVIGQWGQDG